MKTIFTYKGRQYSHKIIDGKVNTYENMGTYDDQVDVENEYEKLTDEDWEDIFQYCEELEKED